MQLELYFFYIQRVHSVLKALKKVLFYSIAIETFRIWLEKEIFFGDFQTLCQVEE